VSGTIKTEIGRGTYRKPTPRSDASRRTVVLPRFAAELLRVRRQFATPNETDAVFATRNGTWHQVVNIERRGRQIRKDTGFEWVTPVSADLSELLERLAESGDTSGPKPPPIRVSAGRGRLFGRADRI
jgi:hypothetical protein